MRTRKQTGAQESDGFPALYAQHGDRIYRFCYRLCGRAAEAEDLTQDVFVAACQGLAGFAGRSSVTTWLYRIALYRWNRVRTQQASEVCASHRQEAIADHADPAQIGLRRLSLAAALGALPDDLRNAFLLVKAEGLKYREAAEVLDVPQGTVQWRVAEAARRLRVLLTETEEREETGHAVSPSAT